VICGVLFVKNISMILECLVISSVSAVGKKSGKPYTRVTVRLPNRKLVTLFSDQDLQSFELQEVSLEIELSSDRDGVPTIRIVKVV